MRIFLGPIEIAGVLAGWAEGLVAAGQKATVCLAYTHPFAYEQKDKSFRILRVWQALGDQRRRFTKKQFIRKLIAVLMHRALSWAVFAWALFRFDAFVFVFGETITNSWLELWLLRRFKRRTVMVYLGSDARPAYLDGAIYPVTQPFNPGQASRHAHRQAARLQLVETMVDLVVNARATGHFHRRRFVNWFALGIPRKAAFVQLPPAGEITRILHCPSNISLKGTKKIQETVARLQAKGLKIELNLIQGRPNSEVIAALACCDLVIDQLYSDTPMAAFATEAASIGRPVLVGAENAEQMVDEVAPLTCPPSICIKPEFLEAELESIVRNPALRQVVALKGLDFVVSTWSPLACGERLTQMIRGDIPDNWWCAPDEVSNVTGCGLTREQAQERLRAVLKWGGKDALALDHSSQIIGRIMAFASEGAV